MSAQASAPRATLDLKVRVWGMGSNNQPFFQNAMAQNVSATGACIYGIEVDLKVGDVIVKLGDYNVSSLENYMEALSKFKKGDKTTVEYKRGNENTQVEIQFNQ